MIRTPFFFDQKTNCFSFNFFSAFREHITPSKNTCYHVLPGPHTNNAVKYQRKATGGYPHPHRPTTTPGPPEKGWRRRRAAIHTPAAGSRSDRLHLTTRWETAATAPRACRRPPSTSPSAVARLPSELPRVRRRLPRFPSPTSDDRRGGGRL